MELKLLIPLESVFSIHLVEHIYGFCIIFIQFCKKVDYSSRPFFSGCVVAQIKEPFIKQSIYLTIYQDGEALLGMGLGEGSTV